MEVSSTALPDSRSRRPISGPLRAIPDLPTQTGSSSQPAAVERAPRVGRGRFRHAATLVVLAVLVPSLGRDTGPSRFTLEPVAFARLQGWSDDRLAAAIPAFLKSCGRLLTLPDLAPLDARPSVADYGRVGVWRELC